MVTECACINASVDSDADIEHSVPVCERESETHGGIPSDTINYNISLSHAFIKCAHSPPETRLSWKQLN